MGYSPQLGDLILVKGNGVIADLIKWAENGTYSHVALYAGDGRVLEAQGGRPIGYAPLSQYAGCYDVGEVLGATYAERMACLIFARSRVGTHYNWGLIRLLAMKLIFHVNRPYYNRKGLEVCSSYVADAWAWAWTRRGTGKQLVKTDKPTPQDCADTVAVCVHHLTDKERGAGDA